MAKSCMDRIRKQYLNALGIETWVRRDSGDFAAPASRAGEPGRENANPAVPASPASGATEAAVTLLDTAGPEIEDAGVADRPYTTGETDWEQLEASVAACTLCDLHKTRTQTVFGTGNRQAGWMVIGEAPGADEDRQGEPFVGRAGKLLNAMLLAIGLQRAEVYIANILKCRPPDNRDPRPGEVMHCEGFLRRQIQLIQPNVILAVGRIAAQNLLKIDTPIGRMRGQVYAYGEARIPVVVTYHPAYLLRSPLQKARVWEDLKLARRVALEGSGEQVS